MAVCIGNTLLNMSLPCQKSQSQAKVWGGREWWDRGHTPGTQHCIHVGQQEPHPPVTSSASLLPSDIPAMSPLSLSPQKVSPSSMPTTYGDRFALSPAVPSPQLGEQFTGHKFIQQISAHVLFAKSQHRDRILSLRVSLACSQAPDPDLFAIGQEPRFTPLPASYSPTSCCSPCASVVPPDMGSLSFTISLPPLFIAMCVGR